MAGAALLRRCRQPDRLHDPVPDEVGGDVAHTLARLRLEALDLPRATAAARAGLLASPWDQRLYADLMQVAEAAGNPAGVKAIWNELLSRFDDEDQIRFDVAAVYKRCRNRTERAT